MTHRYASLATALMVGGLVMGMQPALAGDATRGLVPVSTKVSKQVAADMSEPGRPVVQARCISVRAAASSAKWLYVSASDASGCGKIDTVPTIMTRWQAGWNYVYGMSTTPTCKAMNKGTQSRFGPSAPRSVRQDFRAAGLCKRT